MGPTPCQKLKHLLNRKLHTLYQKQRHLRNPKTATPCQKLKHLLNRKLHTLSLRPRHLRNPKTPTLCQKLKHLLNWKLLTLSLRLRRLLNLKLRRSFMLSPRSRALLPFQSRSPRANTPRWSRSCTPGLYSIQSVHTSQEYIPQCLLTFLIESIRTQIVLRTQIGYQQSNDTNY